MEFVLVVVEGVLSFGNLDMEWLLNSIKLFLLMEKMPLKKLMSLNVSCGSQPHQKGKEQAEKWLIFIGVLSGTGGQKWCHSQKY